MPVPIGKGRRIKAKAILGIPLAGAGITPDDEENFDDLKYIEIEFNMVTGMSPRLFNSKIKLNPVEKTMFEESYKDEIMRRRQHRQNSSDRVKRSKGGKRVASIPGAGGLACV